jgi:hypothetical protein
VFDVGSAGVGGHVATASGRIRYVILVRLLFYAVSEISLLLSFLASFLEGFQAPHRRKKRYTTRSVVPYSKALTPLT